MSHLEPRGHNAIAVPGFEKHFLKILLGIEALQCYGTPSQRMVDLR